MIFDDEADDASMDELSAEVDDGTAAKSKSTKNSASVGGALPDGVASWRDAVGQRAFHYLVGAPMRAVGSVLETGQSLLQMTDAEIEYKTRRVVNRVR